MPIAPVRSLSALALISGAFFGTTASATEREDVADRECRVVLRRAKVVPLSRSQCRLEATVDVRVDQSGTAPKLVVHAPGSGIYAPTAALIEDARVGRFVRYVTLPNDPSLVFPCNPIDAIAVLEMGERSYFDHNANGGDFGMLRVSGDYEVSSEVCAL